MERAFGAGAGAGPRPSRPRRGAAPKHNAVRRAAFPSYVVQPRCEVMPSFAIRPGRSGHLLREHRDGKAYRGGSQILPAV